MLSFSKNKPIIVLNKDTCHLVISGNSHGSEINHTFSLLTKSLDIALCQVLKIDIDLNFYDAKTIVSIKNLFLFSVSNFSKVEVNWTIEDDIDVVDIDVLEKICKIKINKLRKEFSNI